MLINRVYDILKVKHFISLNLVSNYIFFHFQIEYGIFRGKGGLESDTSAEEPCGRAAGDDAARHIRLWDCHASQW